MNTTANAARTNAMDSFADLCGIDIRRGYLLPGDVFDAYLAAISAATYPTADVLSIRLQISVVTFADWRERWHDALVVPSGEVVVRGSRDVVVRTQGQAVLPRR